MLAASVSCPSQGLLFHVLASILPEHGCIFLISPSLGEPWHICQQPPETAKTFCAVDMCCLSSILRTKGTACNSAPGFSHFNLVFTLLGFLTFFTSLLHATSSPMAASKSLPTLQCTAVFPELLKKQVCISPEWYVSKGLLIKQCVRSYSDLYKSRHYV